MCLYAEYCSVILKMFQGSLVNATAKSFEDGKLVYELGERTTGGKQPRSLFMHHRDSTSFVKNKLVGVSSQYVLCGHTESSSCGHRRSLARYTPRLGIHRVVDIQILMSC